MADKVEVTFTFAKQPNGVVNSSHRIEGAGFHYFEIIGLLEMAKPSLIRASQETALQIPEEARNVRMVHHSSKDMGEMGEDQTLALAARECEKLKGELDAKKDEIEILRWQANTKQELIASLDKALADERAKNKSMSVDLSLVKRANEGLQVLAKKWREYGERSRNNPPVSEE